MKDTDSDGHVLSLLSVAFLNLPFVFLPPSDQVYSHIHVVNVHILTHHF